MSHQVDRALEEVDQAMSLLRRAIRGVPAGREGFRGLHDRMARSVGELTVSLSDSRGLVRD